MHRDEVRSDRRRGSRGLGARALTAIGSATLLGLILAGNAQALPIDAGNSASVLNHAYRLGLFSTSGRIFQVRWD